MVAVLFESIASRYVPVLFSVNPVFITAITIVVCIVVTGILANWASASLGLEIDRAEKIQKNISNELRQSEKNFRSLVENSLVGISILQDNRIVYQNMEQEKLLGPLPRPNKLTDFENIYPDDIEKTKAFYKKVASSKVQIGDIDFRFFLMDDRGNRGDMKWVQCRTNQIEYHGKSAILIKI